MKIEFTGDMDAHECYVVDELKSYILYVLRKLFEIENC